MKRLVARLGGICHLNFGGALYFQGGGSLPFPVFFTGCGLLAKGKKVKK